MNALSPPMPNWIVPTPPAGDSSHRVANTEFVTGAISSTTSRPLLLADRTYFVRSDGSNSNNGLTNSSTGAFLTWDAAATALLAIDFNGFNVTVQNGNGATYTAAIILTQAWVGGGTITYDLGGGAISTTGIAFKLDGFCMPAQITVQSGTLGGGFAISHSALGKLQLGAGLTFSTCTDRHLQATAVGANIELTFVSYNISGGAKSHYFAVDGGRIICGGCTATFLSNAVFGTTITEAFAASKANGLIIGGGGTYVVGAFTVVGRRFSAQIGGSIDPNGGQLATTSFSAYFPGDVPGVGTNMGTSPYGFYNSI